MVLPCSVAEREEPLEMSGAAFPRLYRPLDYLFILHNLILVFFTTSCVELVVTVDIIINNAGV